MAPPLTLNLGRLAFLALLCMTVTRCSSDAVGIIDRALECLNNRYVKIYSHCQEDYRLHAEGTIHVPPEAVDGYCGGPCLAETKLVLKCIDGILYNFRFYNGASLKDVGYTLAKGCGHTERRGDFDIFHNIGAEGFGEGFGGGEGEGYGEGYGDYFFGHGNKLVVSAPLLIILFTGVFLMWV